MDANKWIKRTGIACLIIGTAGIMESGLSLIYLFTDRPTLFPEKQTEIWTITYPLLNLFYFIASVSYLLRKSFAVKTMLLALALSLAHSFLIRLLHNSGFGISGVYVPTFTMAAVNILLFGLVYRFRNDYFLSKEALETRYGKTVPHSKSYIALSSIAGFLAVCIPLMLIYLWALATKSGGSHLDQVAVYRNFFPAVLREPFRLNYLSMAGCLCGIWMSSKGLSSAAGAWRLLNYPVLILAIVLLLLDIFQLM